LPPVTCPVKPLLLRIHRWGARPDGPVKGNARARVDGLSGRARAPLTIAAGAALLWVLSGVGFVNYDTLYGLVWGQQLSRGEVPQYGLPIAPTPHPLVELLGLAFAPIGASLSAAFTVALAFLALSACGWAIYRLGSAWFGRAAGILAAAILLTRVPVLSYGVRAYVDVPYLLLVLSALLVETGRRRAGAPVLVLLGLAGLLRPEAWAFSGVYWLYLAIPVARTRRHPVGTKSFASPPPPSPSSPVSARTRKEDPEAGPSGPVRTSRQLAVLALLAAAAPTLWVLSDLLVTGNALWSLTHTKETAETLGRETGIAKVPRYIPERIGEILRIPVLVGAALGGVLSLAWLRERAALGAVAGVLAVLVFAVLAAFGLPIDTRYAFLAGAILCVFCGAGVFGWMELAPGDRRRRPWMVAGAVVLIALLAYTPGQLRSAHHELDSLARQQSIQDELLALVHDRAITLQCGQVGVPNHAPIPLLALYLKARPSDIVSAEVKPIENGTYVDPASVEVERDYILDLRDPHLPVAIPPGFTEAHANSSWLIFRHCR
jgi:hypothetical protein